MTRVSSLLAAGVAAIVGVAAVRIRPLGAERWADVVAPRLAEAIVPLSERGFWPWTPPLALVVIVVAGVLVARAPDRVRAWTRAAGVVLLLGASFEATWGLHAARPGVDVRLGLAGDGRTVDGRADGGRAGDVREGDVREGDADAPGDDERADVDAWPDDDALARVAGRLEAILVRDAPSGAFDERGASVALRESLAAFAPEMRLPRASKRIPSGVLGPLGVAGVISPWTLEAHVDGGLPAWARSAVEAHELAHIAGFASEPDAELVGLLSALRSDHAHLRYAGALRAWTSLPPSTRTAAGLPARVAADLTALREAASARRDAWARPAWWLYDLWLRSRGQELGTDGYAAGTRLLAQADRAGLW